MTVAVARLGADELSRLASALERRRHLPLVRGYKLPREGAVRWIGRLFADAMAADDGSTALVAVEDGELVGGMVVRPAPWESSIYGVPMGRVPFIFVVQSEDVVRSRRVAAALIEASAAPLDALGIRHCSALVLAEDQGVVHALGDAGWRLVDSTMDFTWKCGATNPADQDPEIVLRAHMESDREPLLALARESYTRTIQTRYSVDPWLPIAKTGELYATWFNLACDGEFGDVVVVAEIGGQPVGFNTFKLDRPLTEATGVGFAMHGIAAVEPEFRGRAGQPSMLHWLAEWQRERGGAFNRGRVLLNNYAMQRACLKSGGFVTQGFHTFHVWRGEPPEWEGAP